MAEVSSHEVQAGLAPETLLGRWTLGQVLGGSGARDRVTGPSPSSQATDRAVSWPRKQGIWKTNLGCSG